MKYLIIPALVISALATGVSAQKAAKPTPKVIVLPGKTATADEKAVRDAFEDLLNGIRNSNVDGVTGVYWNSPETFFYNNNGSVTVGWDQDRKNREARYPRTSNVKLEVRNVKVMMLGAGGAVVACQWTQSQEFDANPETASGRMSLVFKKIGKDWKVVHLHTSPDNPPAARPVMPSERNEVIDKNETEKPLDSKPKPDAKPSVEVKTPAKPGKQ